MARINIDDSIFRTNEWTQLLLILRCRERAIGALIWAYIVSQRYWYPNRNPIPHEIWKSENLNQAVLSSGWAQVRDNGILMIECERMFKWLFDAKSKGRLGGLASAQKKRKSSKSNKTTKEVQPQLEHSLAQLNQINLPILPLPLSPIPILPLDNGKKSKNVSIETKEVTSFPLSHKDSSEDLRLVMADYIVAYRSRFGTDPVRSGKIVGTWRRLLSQLGRERVTLLYQVYLQMKDPWFEKKKWDLSTFESNLEKIHLAAAQGIDESDPVQVAKRNLLAEGLL